MSKFANAFHRGVSLYWNETTNDWYCHYAGTYLEAPTSMSLRDELDDLIIQKNIATIYKQLDKIERILTKTL